MSFTNPPGAARPRVRSGLLKRALPALVLLAGGVITVIYTYFFGLSKAKVHTILVGMLTLMIALNCFLIASLDRPFYGLINVSPRAFELAVALMVD